MPTDDLLIRIDATTTGYEAGLARAEAATMQYESSIRKTQLSMAKLDKSMNDELERKARERSSALRGVGNAFGLVGAAAAVGVGLVVKSAMNFDTAMSGVEAATRSGGAELGQLRQAAIDFGQSTRYSATEAADAITELAKAGVSNADILSGALKGSLNLAAAGMIDVADAAKYTATTLNQFELEGSAASHVADVLAAAAGKAQGEVGDIAETMKYVGPVAHQMGISLEETTGAIAELAQNGIQGSQAGTSLRGMLLSLSSPSKAAAAEMSHLGINVYDAQGNFVGFNGVAQQLHTSLKGVSAATRDQALGIIFSNAQVTAARVLYQGGADSVDNWTKKVNDSGFAAEQAAIKMDNLSGDLERLRGSLETAFIGTGEDSQAPLRKMVQTVTALVNAYNSLPGPVKTGVFAIGALTATVGLGVFAASRLVNGYTELKTNLKTLGVTAQGAEGAMSGFNKKAIAIRAGAGIAAAGLFGLSSAVSDSNQDLKTLLNVAGSAAAGFAVGGPWGAAVGGAVGIITALGAAHQRSAQEIHDLAGTLDTETGAVSMNTAEWVKNKLVTDGMVDNAQKLGLSGKIIADAMLGQGDAADRLIPRLQSIIDTDNHLVAAGRGTAIIYGDNARAAQALLGEVTAMPDKLSKANKEWQFNKEVLKATGKNADGTAANMDGLGGSMSDAGKEAKTLSERLDTLNSKMLDERSSARDYQAAIDDATAALKENGRTLNINTTAGRANADALDSLARTAIDHVSAMEKDNQTVKAQREFLKNAREELFQTARQFGMTKDAAHAYVDQVLKIPRSLKTTASLDFQVDWAKVKASIAAGVSSVTGHAAGGPISGPGDGTSDSILARLSTGEHVWTADEVRKAGGHDVVKGLRRLAKKGELPKRGDISRFAEGGPVGDVGEGGGGGDVRWTVGDLFKSISRIFATAVAEQIDSVAAAEIKKALQTTGALGAHGKLTSAQVARGQAFARAQVGKPYVWGGVGPGGYDCSGFQSAVLNAAFGRNPYQRLGSTGTMPWAGSKPGKGIYTIGWTTNAGNGIGHTSGNIGGLNVESYGGHGPAVGSGARSPLDSMFNGLMHYDSGGTLRPGTTLAVNKTGKDEHVLTPGQLEKRLGQSNFPDFHDIAKALREVHVDAKAVIRAEHALKAAREASKNANHQVSQTEKDLEKARGKEHKDKDEINRLETRLHHQRQNAKAAAKDLTKAEKDLGHQRDQLSASTSHLKDAQQAVIDQAKTFRDAVLSIGSLFGGNGTATTAEGLLAKLSDASNQANTFDALLGKLRKRHLNENLLQQLLAEGPTPEAVALAQSLAQAPDALIRKINAQELALEQAAAKIGRLGTGGGGGGNFHSSLPGAGPAHPHSTSPRTNPGSLFHSTWGGGPIYNTNLNGPITVPSVEKLAGVIFQRQQQAVRIAGSA